LVQKTPHAKAENKNTTKPNYAIADWFYFLFLNFYLERMAIGSKYILTEEPQVSLAMRSAQPHHSLAHSPSHSRTLLYTDF